MRWFKHLANASDDEFIHWLESRFGLEGYARWWKLCEAIGRNLKKTDSVAALSLPWPVWETILKGKRKQLRSFLEAIAEQRRINIEQTGDVLRINLPKLLKFRDEYHSVSRHSRDKLTSIDTEIDNREQNTEADALSESGAGGRKPLTKSQKNLDRIVQALKQNSGFDVPRGQMSVLALILSEHGEEKLFSTIRAEGTAIGGAQNPVLFLNRLLNPRESGVSIIRRAAASRPLNAGKSVPPDRRSDYVLFRPDVEKWVAKHGTPNGPESQREFEMEFLFSFDSWLSLQSESVVPSTVRPCVDPRRVDQGAPQYSKPLRCTALPSSIRPSVEDAEAPTSPIGQPAAAARISTLRSTPLSPAVMWPVLSFSESCGSSSGTASCCPFARHILFVNCFVLRSNM